MRLWRHPPRMYANPPNTTASGHRLDNMLMTMVNNNNSGLSVRGPVFSFLRRLRLTYFVIRGMWNLEARRGRGASARRWRGGRRPSFQDTGGRTEAGKHGAAWGQRLGVALVLWDGKHNRMMIETLPAELLRDSFPVRISRRSRRGLFLRDDSSPAVSG